MMSMCCAVSLRSDLDRLCGLGWLFFSVNPIYWVEQGCHFQSCLVLEFIGVDFVLFDGGCFASRLFPMLAICYFHPYSVCHAFDDYVGALVLPPG